MVGAAPLCYCLVRRSKLWKTHLTGWWGGKSSRQEVGRRCRRRIKKNRRLYAPWRSVVENKSAYSPYAIPPVKAPSPLSTRKMDHGKLYRYMASGQRMKNCNETVVLTRACSGLPAVAYCVSMTGTISSVRTWNPEWQVITRRIM